MIEVPRTARGLAKLATPEEIAKEESKFYLASDPGLDLLTDNGDLISLNTGDFGFTHPNLHRRIRTDWEGVDPEKDYPFVYRDKDGNPYDQTVVLGVWDGLNSYRTTTTHTHDEESTTCEIP